MELFSIESIQIKTNQFIKYSLKYFYYTHIYFRYELTKHNFNFRYLKQMFP